MAASLVLLSSCGSDADRGEVVEPVALPPPDAVDPLASLKSISVPEPPDLSVYIRDRAAAIRLGKALFWDMQIGSDGIQACASCHFHAGADSRSQNQLNPGKPNLNGSTFELAPINAQLSPGMYPTHRLADPNDRHSMVLRDVDDVTGSQGIFHAQGVSGPRMGALEPFSIMDDPIFQHTRRTEPRNTPTMINAVFNFRNFWDGRAQHEFNGINPFGARDLGARVLRANSTDTMEAVQVLISNASLASQAVGPPLSEFEMSFAGRTFPRLGRKMLTLAPLAKQLVSPTDSVLGALSNAPSLGINADYPNMIRRAFKPEFWQSNKVVRVEPSGNLTIFDRPDRLLATNEFSQSEYNFSLFFGLAIQMYESTLVADDTPFDRYMEGTKGALSASQIRGMNLFTGKAKCINCHGGPELTKASVRNVQDQKIERMIIADGGCAIYDNGFYNIGVRRTNEDLGVGGLDPFGNPLSMTRLAMNHLPGAPELSPSLGGMPACDSRADVDGSFKVPGLRNVELTAPYFHNGGQFTLHQVVHFYNRGGDFHSANIANLDPDIHTLGLSESDIDDLVDFLYGLTDERVRNQQAPFDHPQLFVPNGQQQVSGQLVLDASGRAADNMLTIPEVGQDGAPLGGNFLR